MENVHLAPDGDDDDLYSGYEYSTIANELEEDPEFQRVIKTGYANRPMLQTSTGPAPVTGAVGFHPPPTGNRRATSLAPPDAQARPMTGVTAAGFSSSRRQQFDPLSQTTKKSLPGMDKANNSPQAIIKKLEKTVNQLIEESTQAAAASDYETALAKAKKAGNKERLLCKEREQNNATDQINFDLTYCVLFNIGNQYYSNKNYRDALNTYLIIVKNKMFNTGGSRLRINMGNIYMDQKKYPQAIKNYRMALDQTSDAHRAVRLKILQNIGIAFVRMGKYSDAITSFDNIMEEEPNFKTALNLILCYYVISDREKLKRTFQRTLSISTGLNDEDRYYLTMEDDPKQRLLLEAIKDDSLRKIENERQMQAERTILTAAKLIAPVIETSFAVGFDWCIENVTESQYSDLASELEITKGLTFLKQSDIPKAIETFKECGKKDNKMAGSASINLSFIYILEGDMTRGEKCADNSISLDRYNPLGLVNKGCCLYLNGEYEKSIDYFQEALNVEATCCEALFNLGLVHKKLGNLEKALETFLKLHAILKNSPQVLYHLGDVYDKMNDFSHASEWFMQLVTLVPTDPHILMRLGAIHDDNNDQSQAYQYHYESFRYCPTNIGVISWLGAYYMDSQYADKAIHYFERAALIQPTQVNWQLMVASCYRKIGNYQQALQIYKQIHIKFPDDVDCLKFLVKLCSDLRLKEVQEYSLKLKKAEKLLDSKKQRESADHRSKGSAAVPQIRSGISSMDSEASANRRGHSPMTPSKSRFHQSDQERLTSGGSVESRGSSSTKRVDATYQDPIGELHVRRLASGSSKQPKEDEFDDDELGDDLLPE